MIKIHLRTKKNTSGLKKSKSGCRYFKNPDPEVQKFTIRNPHFRILNTGRYSPVTQCPKSLDPYNDLLYKMGSKLPDVQYNEENNKCAISLENYKRFAGEDRANFCNLFCAIVGNLTP